MLAGAKTVIMRSKLVPLLVSSAILAIALGGDTHATAQDQNPPATAPQPPESQPEREGWSLLGKPLYAEPLPADVHAKRAADLQAAQEALGEDPENEDKIIWLGRRIAYMGRYREAIFVFSRGLAIHPESYKLLRHRGHRYISVRQFGTAIDDLKRAAELINGVEDEIEPDGMPNAQNIPRSTSHSNIYYHLGLSYYLTGRFDECAATYRKCLEFSKNDDMRVASSYWLYLSSMRSGNQDAAYEVLAAIRDDMDVIENFAYHKLLLLFKGDIAAQDVIGESEDDLIQNATASYGIGAWHLVNGREAEARKVFQRIVDGAAWPAFGSIAAEAELARAR